MADGVYISKNMDEVQLRFMKLLETNEILYFSIDQIEDELNVKFTNINEILENLVNKELLFRIERGKYALRNYNNINVLSSFISPDSAIAYWSALYHHGLTERFPNTVFVKTPQRKRDTYILGTKVQFVTVKERKNIGKKAEGYGDNRFPVTDIEMTFVDCFDQPRYAGDFADLIRAFANAKLTNTKLIDYTTAYNNISLTKRLGFLAELFHQDNLKSFIRYAQSQVNQRYSLMDAGGIEAGEFNNDWKLRLNVSKKQLLQMVQNEY